MIEIHYRVFFLVAPILLLFLKFILPYLTENKCARISRHYQRTNGVRYQLINEISDKPDYLPNDLTSPEMVGILALIYAKHTVSQSHSAAQRFADMGWKNKFNDDFFDQLNMTARKFYTRRWYREGVELFRLGQLLAKTFNNPHWAAEFKFSAEKVNYRRIYDEEASRKKNIFY